MLNQKPAHSIRLKDLLGHRLILSQVIFWLTDLLLRNAFYLSHHFCIREGPIIGDEEEILRIKSAEDSRPPILVKWWDDEKQPQGIVVNRQKEEDEVALLTRTLNQVTRLVKVSVLPLMYLVINWIC